MSFDRQPTRHHEKYSPKPTIACDPGTSLSDDIYRCTDLRGGIFDSINFQNAPKKNVNNLFDRPFSDTLDDVINFGGLTSIYPQDRDPWLMSIASNGTDYYGLTDVHFLGSFQQSDLLSDRKTFDFSLNTGGSLDPFEIVIGGSLYRSRS